MSAGRTNSPAKPGRFAHVRERHIRALPEVPVFEGVAKEVVSALCRSGAQAISLARADPTSLRLPATPEAAASARTPPTMWRTARDVRRSSVRSPQSRTPTHRRRGFHTEGIRCLVERSRTLRPWYRTQCPCASGRQGVVELPLIATRWPAVRKISRPSEIAGVANTLSVMSLSASNSNVGEALST